MAPFILISPATAGLSLALVRHYLRTTSLPVFATYRPSSPSGAPLRSPDSVRAHILQPLAGEEPAIDPARLHPIPLDLASEDSIRAAAAALARALSESKSESESAEHGGLPRSSLHTAFFCGGVLHPERQPADLALAPILDTFRLNVVSHLLLIKHFSCFLPPATAAASEGPGGRLAKWVHVSARVGSIADNRLGGWYSYRASKAALNQVVRTFDLHLRAKDVPAICVGVHPGTVRTELSRAFWKSVPPGKLFEPEDAAAKLARVVRGLEHHQGGRVWDWKGDEVMP